MNLVLSLPDVADGRNRILRYEARIEGRSDRPLDIVGYTAELWLNGVRLPNQTVFTAEQIPRSGTREFRLEFPLGRDAVRAIEEARAGGDISVSLGMRFLVAQEGAQISVAYASPSQQQLISAHHWLKLLQGLGHGDTEVFEVRVPGPPASGPLATASAHVKRALELLNRGDYDEAVTNCRKALEAVLPIVTTEDRKSMHPDLAARFDQLSQGDGERPAKSARIDGVRKTLYQFLHVGPHQGFHITRPEAEFAIRSTLALLSLYGRELEKVVASRS